MKEIIKQQSAKYVGEASLDDLQTILVKKDALDPDDIEKHRYLELLARQHREVTRALAQKNSEKTFEALNLLEESAALAFDVNVLKEVRALQGVCSTYFSEWTLGIKKYKAYVSLSFLLFSMT